MVGPSPRAMAARPDLWLLLCVWLHVVSHPPLLLHVAQSGCLTLYCLVCECQSVFGSFEVTILVLASGPHFGVVESAHTWWSCRNGLNPLIFGHFRLSIWSHRPPTPNVVVLSGSKRGWVSGIISVNAFVFKFSGILRHFSGFLRYYFSGPSQGSRGVEPRQCVSKTKVERLILGGGV